MALPAEEKIRILKTLRKLYPREKLSTEPVENLDGIMPEDAANSGLKSD